MSDTGWSLDFAADRLPEFEARIAKANNRLARAGAPLFAPVISEPWMKSVPVQGGSILVPFVSASLESYRLTLGDYTFVASLVPEEAGITVHTAPGESLDGFRPEDFRCDHCKVDRYRTRNYIVRDDKTGQLIQLGHNCIELYTGLKPKGLWVLSYSEDQLAEFAEDEGGWGGGGFGARDYSVSIDTVLALSYVYSDGGRKYISKAKAEEWDRTATVDMVRGHLFSPPKPQYDREGYEAYLAKGREAAALGTDVLDAIRASAATLRPGTEYGDNMAVILAAESGAVSHRNLGILASLVTVYRRNLEDEEERKSAPAPAKGFLGEPGEKLRGLEITAKVVRVWEGYYGPTTFLVASTDDGHTVTWKASGGRDWEPGDRIKLSFAKVKAQEVYQGVDQTQLTGCRVA